MQTFASIPTKRARYHSQVRSSHRGETERNLVECFLPTVSTSGCVEQDKDALGGSLNKEHIVPLHKIGIDVIGIRGAACEMNNRNGMIKKEKVRELKNIIEKLK